MSREEYIGSLVETLPTLSDNQIKYLYHLIDVLFGKNEESEGEA